MEAGHAVHRGDWHRREGAVREGRKDRHPRGAANDSRQHAGHEVVHRPAGLLATGGGGQTEEIDPRSGIRDAGSVVRDPSAFAATPLRRDRLRKAGSWKLETGSWKLEA